MGGIVIAFFQVDVHAIAPGVLFHDADKFGAEGVLCAVRIITQGFEHRIGAVIGNRQKPADVGPFVDVGHHAGNTHAAFGDRSSLIHFEREQANGINAVTVVTQGFIHSGIAHECPDHNAFSFEFIHQNEPPPSFICCNSKSTLADFPSSRVTTCLESQAALY